MSKKTKLIVGGCSYTYGGNDEDAISNNWAEQLADRLNMKLVNTSKNGMGNEFILNKITEAIYTHNNIGLVIAMWSEFERIDIPVSPKAKRLAKLTGASGVHYRQYQESCYNENYFYWSSLHAGVLYEPEEADNMIKRGWNPNKVDSWLENQNKMVHIWNEWQNGKGQAYSKIVCLKKSLLQMLLFKQLLKSKGLDYMHCVGTNPYVRGEYNVKHTNLKGQQYSKAILDSVYFDELDEPKFIGFPIMEEIGGYWFDTLLPVLPNENNKVDLDYRVSEDDTHPNTKGHKIFADKLYDEYTQIYG